MLNRREGFNIHVYLLDRARQSFLFKACSLFHLAFINYSFSLFLDKVMAARGIFAQEIRWKQGLINNFVKQKLFRLVVPFKNWFYRFLCKLGLVYNLKKVWIYRCNWVLRAFSFILEIQRHPNFLTIILMFVIILHWISLLKRFFSLIFLNGPRAECYFIIFLKI